MDSLDWHVLRCQPRKELQVHNTLTQKSITTYYPTVKVKSKNPRASKIQPYFPGYIFVQADLNAVLIKDLRWLPGVIGLVQFGDYVATVGNQFITELKSKVAEISANDGLSTFKKGDRVRITQGPLAGYEGLFDTALSGKERAIILLQFLARSSKVETDITSLEKIK